MADVFALDHPSRRALTGALLRTRGFAHEGLAQTVKLAPQPQDAFTFGLSILKDWPIRSSTKSIRVPRRKSSDTESTSTTAPSFAITKSSGSRSCVTSNAYWKPEQPPPLTATRSAEPGASLARIAATRRAARSVTSTGEVVTVSFIEVPGRRCRRAGA